MEQQFFILAKNFDPRLHPAMVSQISRQLNKTLKQPLCDISQTLKYGMGLYRLPASSDHISEIISIFQSFDISIQHLEFHQVKNLKRPIPLGEANITEDSLEVVAPKSKVLYWSNIVGIHFGIIWPKGYEFPFSQNEHFELLKSIDDDEEARNALKDKMYEGNEEQQGIITEEFLDAFQNREMEVLCDIVVAGNQVYRISLEFFNFANFEDKGLNSLENLSRFVSQMAKYTEKTFLSAPTEAFIHDFSLMSDYIPCSLFCDSERMYEGYLRSLITQWNLSLNES